ncbi:MAG TPA: hypothetical protein VMH28_27875 [Candidatus Acidoferrales bacterium]|nr:hypothetical protein [Candidatus Acidoferrales bacterium]
MKDKSNSEGGPAAPETNSQSPAGSKVPTAWAIPLITAAIVAGIFLVYYFVYVGARREYLANRNFRALAFLGEQIQQSVSIHGNILDFCADLFSGEPEKTHVKKLEADKFLIVMPEDKLLKPPERETEALGDYLKYLAPGMELNQVQDVARGAGLHVERRNDTWELILGTFQDSRSKATYQGSLKVADMMAPLVASLPFDDVLLVSQEGFIVYQSKQTGPQFTTLTSLLQAQITGSGSQPEAKPGTEGKKTEGKGPEAASIRQNSDPAWRSRSMHLTDLLLAGTRYKLFLQPLLISPFADEKKRSEPASELVLCGLRSSSELDWEALSLSYTFFIWITAGFFIVWSSYKALKILLMNNRERLRLRELGTLAISLVLLTSVLTIAALQADFHANDETDGKLQQLSQGMLANIHDELSEMMSQLVQWCHSDKPKQPGILHDLEQFTNDRVEIIRNTAPKGPPIRGTAPDAAPPTGPYPLASNVFWTDDDGHQIVKWSATQYVTPMIDVSQLATFVRPTMRLEGKGPAFQLASILPPNKLEYLATLGVRTRECVNADLPDDIGKGLSVLTAQPLSVIDPILPDGYGFAIVDRSGAVHFHSDKNRNGRENFLLESDGSKELYAAVFGHASPRPISIKYMGKDHRALVSPVSSVSQAPWSLIVFRDLTAMRTLNLQVMTLTSTLLFAVFVGPVLVVWIAWLMLRPRFAPEWLWPNRRRSSTYLHQVVIYLVLVLVFLLATAWASTETVILVCAALPYSVLAATWWCYRRYGPAAGKTYWQSVELQREHESSLVRASHSYQNRYLAAALLVLLLLGVLMPMALFRASLDVERRLAVKEAQLHLATAIGQRWLAIIERHEDSLTSAAAWTNLRESQDAWRRIVPDNLTPFRELRIAPHVEQGRERFHGWLRHILYLLHHDYNDSSAEMLGVIDDRGNPSNWTWEQEDGTITLRWHGPHPPLKAPASGEAEKSDPVTSHDDLMIATSTTGFLWRDRGVYGLVAVLVMFGTGGLLWALTRRLFLMYMAPLRMTGTREVAEAIREGRSVLILLPPISDWQLDVRKKTVDVSELKTLPSWNTAIADLFTTPANVLIELRHFEFRSEDPEVDNQKLAVLDRLLKRAGTQVAAIMTVPPSAEDYRRKFPTLETIDLRDEPFTWLKQYAGPAQELIARECSPMPALWPLGAQLAKDMSEDTVQTEDTVASEILERADPYYRMIWNECSDDQKFVLCQLAWDGLLNPTNGRAIRQLIRRGLITREPQFRIMNESFRRFLRSASTSQLKREWLAESRRSGWGRMHGAFFTGMTLFGVFLLATQNALWQSAAAYVTTALGSLGSLSKLLDTLKEKTTPEKS